jgi:hypothetical protein
VRQHRAIAPRPLRERGEEPQDPLPEIDRQRQDRAQLDDDGEHLPVAILQIDAQQRFGNAQMRGRAYRQKFGQAFDDAQDQGKKIGVQACMVPPRYR